MSQNRREDAERYVENTQETANIEVNDRDAVLADRERSNCK